MFFQTVGFGDRSEKNFKTFFLGKHLHLCPWSLASSIPVLVLGLEHSCPCPWPRALCLRHHFWTANALQDTLLEIILFFWQLCTCATNLHCNAHCHHQPASSLLFRIRSFEQHCSANCKTKRLNKYINFEFVSILSPHIYSKLVPAGAYLAV